ncbi:MAG: FkbM family methyltransferase [bacterium]|nr:FkbM family methyltransferase [bacterium]MDA1292310.1 FkbM family methyltransferase [bacterium]
MPLLQTMRGQRYKESAEISTYSTSIGEIWIGEESRREQHYRGVVNEVIQQDCYGVQALKRSGFSPKIIVDIGAHIGTFTRMCAHAWPEANIYCLEVMRNEHICGPFARAIAQSLDKNVEEYPNISVTRKGMLGHLGDPSVEVVTHTDFGKLRPALEDRIRDGSHRWAEGISVSDFLQENAIDHIDLLKIDVEGCEVNIFREFAALHFLEKINEIRGEWHFEIARTEITRLLEPTHHVDILWSDPKEEWNTFTAVRR